MKSKTLLICIITLLILSFTACDTGINGGIFNFNPPSWIIGEWEDASTINNYVFTSNNVVFTTTGSSTNFSETAKLYDYIENANNNSEYTFSDEFGSGTYRFVKVTDTTLNYSITSSGVTIGPLVLVKQ